MRLSCHPVQKSMDYANINANRIFVPITGCLDSLDFFWCVKFLRPFLSFHVFLFLFRYNVCSLCLYINIQYIGTIIIEKQMRFVSTKSRFYFSFDNRIESTAVNFHLLVSMQSVFVSFFFFGQDSMFVYTVFTLLFVISNDYTTKGKKQTVFVSKKKSADEYFVDATKQQPSSHLQSCKDEKFFLAIIPSGDMLTHLSLSTFAMQFIISIF